MPPLLEFMLNPLEMKSKEKIINILINKYPLSIMQIHHSLDGDKHSYQATFKNVKELVAEGILINNHAKHHAKIYVKITGNTSLDKISRKYYSGKNCISKIVPSFNNINYYGTSGPFLLKLSVPKELAKQLDELYQKARSYEDLDYIRFMELINGKQKINVELINNSFLAETIAKKIISDVQSV